MVTKIEIILDAGKYAIKELTEYSTKQVANKKGTTAIGDMLNFAQRSGARPFVKASRYATDFVENVGNKMGMVDELTQAQKNGIISYLNETQMAYKMTKSSNLNAIFSSERRFGMHTREYKKASGCAS